ncbi:EpsG family protein [Limosilactobacillus reuteri]|uniref:EpsG family protein n=1 Tax=Limosilactobacillus reuteri TaxID=1598 RepID=UPI00155A49AA|nr:EpsG family protein [Limosilactobacillus reuteri]
MLNFNVFAIFSAIILALFSGLRNINVGFDTINYYSDYENIKNSLVPLHSTEFGYVLLERICAFFGMQTWIFIFLISLITLIGLYIAYKDMLQVGMIGLALCYYYARFFILRDMNQIRSSLASVIVLFSFKFVREKKMLKFLIVIFLASSIHLGAMVCLLIYPIFSFMSNFNLKYKTIFSTSLMVICLLFANLISPLLNRVSVALDRGSAYINNQYYTTGNGLKNPVMYYQIIILLLVLFRANKGNIDMSLVAGYLLSTLILILCYQYSSLAGRLSTFTASVEPILLVYLLKTYLPKYTRIPIFVSLIIVIFIVINYINGTIPKMGIYTTVFS